MPPIAARGEAGQAPLFLVLASRLLGSAKFACLQRQKPAMFAQMPVCVYRHFTGAACTTSSDGRFAAFSLASRLSKSSDMVRSRTSRSRPLFSAPNSKLFAGNYSCMRMRKARSTAAHGTNGNRTQGCAFGRAGCEGDGRLHCDSKWRDRRLQLQAAVSLQAVEQAVADTAERAAVWPKPDQRRRNATASNRPHSDLSVYCHQSSTIMPMRVMC